MLDLIELNPVLFILSILGLLVAITIHEFAHAYAADRLGDPTPRLMGRLTLNPLAHLDPLGTLLLILIRFGWGKPVQFDPYNLKNPRRDSAIIALAGPFSNMLLASAISIFMKLVSVPSSPLENINPYLLPFLLYNVLLAVFNLIPIHPLDGGKILVGLLPPANAHKVDRFLSRNGMYILIFLVFPIFWGNSLVTLVISPIVSFLLKIYLPASQFI